MADLSNKVEKQTERIGGLVRRYRSGEFDPVWREIRSYRMIDGDFREEVLEVAEETMKRVARNAELLRGRLEAVGWEPLSEGLRTSPSTHDAEVFVEIEAMTKGPLPPTLRAFWAVVGGIDWVWNYSSSSAMPKLGVDLPMDEMDPLYVQSPQVVTYLFDEWMEQKTQSDSGPVAPFSLDLAPDHYHKANISGGPPYAIELPFWGADPIFANEKHELPFVDYLRLCFKWAGFPGLEKHADREDVQRFVLRFGDGLEPF